MKLNRNKKQEPVSILEGLVLSEEVYLKKENRIWTLLLKGLILYCVAAGLLGCALTSTGSDFSHLAFNISIIIYSVIISFIYYNKKTENIGDLIYILIIIAIGIRFGRYINSGFYSWMNDVIGVASVYFNLPEIGGYVVKYASNMHMNLTFAACYLGAIFAIVINLSIIKKMHFLDLILDIILVLFMPAYLELEPDAYYIIILVIGIALSVVWCMTGRFEKIDNSKSYVKLKKEITYTYNVKTHLFSFIQIGIGALFLLLTFLVVFPKDDYKLIRTTGSMKQRTDEYFEIFITSGLYGFFNQYDNNGGISSGRLGGVASVNLDYETDIMVTYVPYNMSPVYLRNFIANEYVPYENRWHIADEEYINYDEYEHLEAMYNAGVPYIGRYKFLIENIAGEYGGYYSYYAPEHGGIRRNTVYESISFPRFFKTPAYGWDMELTDEERKYWLSIPNDNRPTLMSTAELIGISSDMNPYEVASAIKEYFADNIPYTLRPGATPWKKDFVNYFLSKNKKGYCVHFASAATLLFRQCGIPARYVEGYAFDYNDILAAKNAEGINPADFADGYTEIDEKVAITVNVLDANAHAWVEIYTDEYGWIPVEVTPPSSDVDMGRESFLDRFIKLFGNVRTINNNEEQEEEQKHFDNSKLRGFMIVVLCGIIVLPLLYLLYRLIVAAYRYYIADINTRLIYKYRRFLRVNRKRYPLLIDARNYKEALECVFGSAENKENVKKVISILEKAGFSDNMITPEEFEFACRFLKQK